MKGAALALCAVLGACSSRGSDAGDAGASGALPPLFGSGGGSGGNVVDLAGRDAGLVDDAGRDAGDGPQVDAGHVDAGELVDDAGRDAGEVPQVDAGHVDAGDPTAGTFPGELALDNGPGFKAGEGCAAGFLNCDGIAANGCELALGCPAVVLARCAAPNGAACVVAGCTCSTSYSGSAACGEHRCP